jgi:hypothetical protein
MNYQIDNDFLPAKAFDVVFGPGDDLGQLGGNDDVALDMATCFIFSGQVKLKMGETDQSGVRRYID